MYSSCSLLERGTLFNKCLCFITYSFTLYNTHENIYHFNFGYSKFPVHPQAIYCLNRQPLHPIGIKRETINLELPFPLRLLSETENTSEPNVTPLLYKKTETVNKH